VFREHSLGGLRGGYVGQLLLVLHLLVLVVAHEFLALVEQLVYQLWRHHHLVSFGEVPIQLVAELLGLLLAGDRHHAVVRDHLGNRERSCVSANDLAMALLDPMVTEDNHMDTKTKTKRKARRAAWGACALL
jgi:hypothetical protein